MRRVLRSHIECLRWKRVRDYEVIYDGFELHDFAYEPRFATPVTLLNYQCFKSNVGEFWFVGLYELIGFNIFISFLDINY